MKKLSCSKNQSYNRDFEEINDLYDLNTIASESSSLDFNNIDVKRKSMEKKRLKYRKLS